MAKNPTARPSSQALVSASGTVRNPPLKVAASQRGLVSQPVGQLSSGGGGITVAHTRRQIKAYNFTESDLDTISLTNTVTGVSFAIATGILTFCIDFNKDVLFTPTATNAVQSLQFTINWLGVPVAVACGVVGIMAWLKRGTVITRVKNESQNVPIDE